MIRDHLFDPVANLAKRAMRVLAADGFVECRVVRTRTTGRVHYEKYSDGVRFVTAPDPSFAPDEERGTIYVGVRTRLRSKRELATLAKSLERGGFHAVTCGSLRSKRLVVWLRHGVRIGEP